MRLHSRYAFAFLSVCLCISVSVPLEIDEGGIRTDTYKYSVQCAQRQEISPCNCYYHGTKAIWIKVICQKMNSFSEVINALRNKFDRSAQILLDIQYSKLEDLAQKQFKEIESKIEWLWLNKNDMGDQLSDKSFEGIDSVTTLMLIDSKITQFPGAIFVHMPNVGFISIERTFIKSLSPADFKSLKKLSSLTINNSNLTYIESDTFPPTLKRILLSDNNITTLNNTLRNNSNLELLIVHSNSIDSMDGQLWESVEKNTKLTTLDVSSNRLTKLPESLRNCIRLTLLLVGRNNISSLDEILKNMHKLTEFDIAGNRISQLSTDEFKECVSLANLNMSFNEISNLNKSLKPLKALELLNLTYNRFTEFSIDEVTGLTNLKALDLSHNSITKFIGKTEKNVILPETSIGHLILIFNKLETLEGSLAEIKGLTHLNMSHNHLRSVPTSFFDGMQELQVLDLSYNYLHTLNDVSKAVLPSLGTLFATFNEITELNRNAEKGFTAVCFIQLQFNKIEHFSPNFTDKNQCVYQPGTNATLYVDLDGNDVLCKSGFGEIKNAVESKNNTKILGRCWNLHKKLEYNVPLPRASNNESSPIIVTLDEKTL